MSRFSTVPLWGAAVACSESTLQVDLSKSSLNACFAGPRVVGHGPAKVNIDGSYSQVASLLSVADAGRCVQAACTNMEHLPPAHLLLGPNPDHNLIVNHNHSQRGTHDVCDSSLRGDRGRVRRSDVRVAESPVTACTRDCCCCCCAVHWRYNQ